MTTVMITIATIRKTITRQAVIKTNTSVLKFLMNRMTCSMLLNSKEYNHCRGSGIGGITSKDISDTDGEIFYYLWINFPAEIYLLCVLAHYKSLD